MRASDELATLVRDLKQFASVFAAPIHQSAPHIYISALAFAPMSSVMHGLCRQFPKTVRLRQGRMVDWPRLVHVFTGHTDDCERGRHIARWKPSGVSDRMIRLFDSGAQQQVWRLVSH